MSITTMAEAPLKALEKIGLHPTKHVHYQLTPAELTEQTIKLKQGVLNDTGALLINTGELTGRSPNLISRWKKSILTRCIKRSPNILERETFG